MDQNQNQKTFIIQQGKIKINQSEDKEIDESLYIGDKKFVSTNKIHPNILGLEASRTYNKINNITGAFIGFYDDSIITNDKILMGSIGFGIDYNDTNKAINYTPYIIYNKIDKDGKLKLTSLNLIPEAGNYIKIENNKISHKLPETKEEASFIKIGYDNFGHITNSSIITKNDIRNVARISYGVKEPNNDFIYELGEPQEGDIYIWVQNE